MGAYLFFCDPYEESHPATKSLGYSLQAAAMRRCYAPCFVSTKRLRSNLRSLACVNTDSASLDYLHLPLEDRQACLPGVERANIRVAKFPCLFAIRDFCFITARDFPKPLARSPNWQYTALRYAPKEISLWVPISFLRSCRDRPTPIFTPIPPSH